MDYSYVEVMKNKNRMCKEVTDCEMCPLGHKHNGHKMLCSKLASNYPEEAQEIIMKWAEAHKVKTNLDVFCEMFGVEKEDIDITDCPFNINVCDRNSCVDCDDCEYDDWWLTKYTGEL